ncbi:MAG: hypothetical protein AMJ79_13985 [Phycisphaerae bacterium SM23_30]|nr:MAG: hypothetical protein AMJ79_13985 [Phycisphaerae bacterium SM23_30]
MTLSERLTQDLKEATKQRDQVKLNVIRMIRSQLKYAQIQKGTDFSSEDEIMVLQQEARKRREAIEAYQKANAMAQMKKEQAELAIVQKYLPAALTEEELNDIIDKIITDTGAASPKDIGKVMQPVMAEVLGKADGKIVQELVRKKLGA